MKMKWLYQWYEEHGWPLSPEARLGKSTHSSVEQQISELESLQGPYREFRKDGWPLCPNCGEDELWSAEMKPTVETITSCLKCHWRPR